MNARKRLMFAGLILVMSLASVLPASAGVVEGCTPGFWRNHPSVWPTNPNRLLNEFFGDNVPFDTSLTLWQAVNLKGGGINAVARHAAAGVLNILHPQVDYAFENPPNTPEGWQAAFELLNYLVVFEFDTLVHFNETLAPGFCE